MDYQLIGVLVAAFLLLLAIRQFVLWYWKINAIYVQLCIIAAEAAETRILLATTNARLREIVGAINAQQQNRVDP